MQPGSATILPLFRQIPNPRIDFIRLKYRSICQRQRYQASTAVASSIAVDTSVQTKKYPASNRAVRDSFFCFLEARFRNARRSQQAAQRSRLTATSRPG